MVRERTQFGIIHRLTRTISLVYQPFMLYAMKRWFPDWEEQVTNAGGQIHDYDVNVSLSGAKWGSPSLIQSNPSSLPRHPNIPSGQVPKHFALSRPIFEPLLRKLALERYPNIRIVTGVVTGIALDSKKRRVQTATYTVTGAKINQPCAFFIDCTGRGHTGTKWLSQAGLPAPKVITYKSNLRYASSETPCLMALAQVLNHFGIHQSTLMSPQTKVVTFQFPAGSRMPDHSFTFFRVTLVLIIAASGGSRWRTIEVSPACRVHLMVTHHRNQSSSA